MFEKYNHNLDLHFVVYPNKMRLVTAKFPFLQKLTHMTKVRYASGNVFFYITWFPRKPKTKTTFWICFIEFYVSWINMNQLSTLLLNGPDNEYLCKFPICTNLWRTSCPQNCSKFWGAALLDPSRRQWERSSSSMCPPGHPWWWLPWRRRLAC